MTGIRWESGCVFSRIQESGSRGVKEWSKFINHSSELDGKCVMAMVYSLLSAQRPWAEVVKHLDEIDGLFFGYDAKKILEQIDTYFLDRIREIKCGNRNIYDQMKYLPDNIATLRSIEKEYCSLDAFVSSAPAHEIVKTLTDYKSKYKLRNMGEALCWEFLFRAVRRNLRCISKM